MILHTARLFVDGPVKRVLDLAASVRESDGALDLDMELRRFLRLTRATMATDWICPIATVNAMLDHVARLCAEGGEEIPREFEQLLQRAAGGADATEFLHALASRLRALEQDPWEDYDVLPLSRWEIQVRFPQLYGFGYNWLYEGEYENLRDAVEACIATEHPYCAEFLSPVAAEAQTALVLFPGEQEMKKNLSSVVFWATPQTLREFLDAVNEHMRREHVPQP
ncbi:hypothetical protein GCM10009535_23690 [Streptomyces thermocarboxydovorans]|uniref:Uncharacterized protein n=1 Tax=Streptomyces thermocarboxydovorans TaxID=59298 RepID=A0ABP3SRA6_9ACTN